MSHQEEAGGPLHVQQHPTVQAPPPPTSPWRSQRTRVEPQRLNVQSWSGQSYDGIAGHVGYPHGHAGLPYYSMTAPYSVGHTYGLHPSVPGGGGGISGYGLPSNHQTKSWPWPYVHNNG